MIVGVTGHQALPEDHLAEIVASTLAHLQQATVVLSSLAIGADQLVSRLAIDRGIPLDVIIPCSGYREEFDGPSLDEFDKLLGAASSVTELPFPRPGSEAFLAAGLLVAERADLLLAVWDGRPAEGLGGTADVVGYAKMISRRVVIVWPRQAGPH